MKEESYVVVATKTEHIGKYMVTQTTTFEELAQLVAIKIDAKVCQGKTLLFLNEPSDITGARFWPSSAILAQIEPEATIYLHLDEVLNIDF